ncbi:helix-turn-helix domain-containing protein [Actinomadura hibisca]|uniref:helix-turn-helix domain-containing protein n=1 Tax=Actinomadura hibisca TaxID=68565 RepID=UPI000A06DF51|nr:helix-turn-helix transcriptional regulator [Actinomadura hibisca]
MATRRRAPELKAFGSDVTRYREAAGFTLTELARKVAVSRSYIGQVESGTTRCREDFARRVDEALNAQGEIVKSWTKLIRGTKYPRYFVDFSKVEGTAVQLRAYETHNVYGLFQTKNYMSTLLSKREDIDSRMSRQERVLNDTSDTAPKVYVVLEESILYREIGSPETMREQLEFLLEISFKKNICLQVLPSHAFVPDARASFTIATQEDRREVVYAIKATGGETSDDPADLARVNDAFAMLQAEALNVKDTRALIRKVIEERWT